MSKTLHLFDFDGTLTKKDSLFHFLRFLSTHINKKYDWIFLTSLPQFMLAKIGLINKARVKERFIKKFIQGQSVSDLSHIAKKYAIKVEEILRPQGLSRLKDLQRDSKNDIYIVSASMDLWLAPIAEKLQTQLIATQAEIIDGKYTGNFKGKNCNGEEKRQRIIKEIPLDKYTYMVAYGDTKGDKEMLTMADEAHFKPF